MISEFLHGSFTDTELPPYQVRLSARARYLQLKVSSLGVVEVVVPKHVNLAVVPDFVAEHKQWLWRTLHELRKQAVARPDLHAELPAQIYLQAIGETWGVEYVESNQCSGIQLRMSLLQLAATDAYNAQQQLQRWLSDQARTHLVPWLHRVSEETGLPFRKVTVRAQKTRWGSCSARKDININRSLLFLPADAVRYLFVHELCHTRYLNHSKRYWQLVDKLQPNYLHWDKLLRQSGQYVPHWACRV